MRKIYLSLGAIFASTVLGCGGAPTPELTDASRTQNQTPTESVQTLPEFVPARPSKTYDDPQEAVTDFLSAVIGGNDELATALLTTSAQEEAWRNGLAVTGEKFQQAHFEITAVEYLNENREAHVMSECSDVTADGEKKSFECVWLLSRETHGWCVYGVATKFLEGVDPVVMNFEDQRDMRRKEEWAAQQLRQHQLAQQQTTPPATTTDRPPIQQANRPQAQQVR